MNLRLVTSRIVAGVLVAALLFTTHRWTEHGPLDDVLGAFGLTFLLIACLGRIWCAAHIAGHKDSTLVDKGPFSITRNPLYFFSLFGFIGTGLGFESFTLAAVFGTLFLATHWPTILYEEGKLREIFGAPYDAYCARVPRFLPNPRLFSRAETMTLKPKAFNRSLLEAGLIPFIYLGAQIIEALHENGILPAYMQLY